MPPSSPLVVFSHLRWDFVFQRPQHVMTRLAARRPVVFIEEPVPDPDGEPRWETSRPAPGVTVCRPRVPAAAPGFGGSYDVLPEMVYDLVAEHVDGPYDVWLFTPLAHPIAACLEPRVVVYDHMDDLTAFRFADPMLRQTEEDLLEWAHVVFTGGPSLYRAMRDRHPNVHCFSSSVDAAHFARVPADEPADQASIPRPRLGYVGVVDERFDTELLADVADARPGYHFAIVGPVAKIDPATLPQRANIHYLGGKPYQDLPAYIAGWDVALMPFARNEATRKISPTKVLEYIAAGKPVVSTPITDIVEPYGDMVWVAENPAEFAQACDEAVSESESAVARRKAQYGAVLGRTSWDRVAERMHDLIEAAARDVSPPTRPEYPAVVIGAGPTGLSAAYHLGEGSLLVEANDRVGGWCRSIVDGGFTFDYAGHIMFSNDPYVHEMYELLLGDNVHWQDREAWVYSHGVHTRYPFQGSLYGLPAEVVTECLVGAIEARFGPLKGSAQPAPTGHTPTRPHSNGTANGQARNPTGHALAPLNGHSARHCGLPTADPKDEAVSDCCGDGVAETTLPAARLNGHAPPEQPTGQESFATFIDRVWGRGIAKHFAVPYNRKIWAVPLEEMETSWLGGRVPMPDLEDMIAGALSPKPKPMGPNARFGYPLRGGFQALMDGFLPHLQGEVRLNTRVRAISPSRKVITFADGTEAGYERLVSTMPLPALIRAMGDEVPAAVRQAAAGLRHTSVRCVNLGVGRENLTEKHWIYYPGDTVFHRIFVQGNASPHCNPPGGFGLTCEITYGPLKPLPCDGPELIRRCVEDCVRVGMLRPDDPILVANQVDMPYAYVVYDHARTRNVAVIRDWLQAHDIHPAGRYAEWEYYNSDHAFLAGKKAAEAVRLDARATLTV